MTGSPKDERLLIGRVVDKDPSAYRILLKRYNHYAFSIAMKIVKNREDAEEIVQDSFIKAFKAIRNYNGKGKFSTWLFKIVYNTALTKIRNKRIIMDSLEEFPNSDFDFEIPDDYPGSFEKLVQVDQAAILNRALSNLSEAENLSITLYYTCGNSISDIQLITGWNASTIKIRLFRARQKIYDDLSMYLKNEVNDLL